jgi:serine/threonine-protein kinase
MRVVLQVVGGPNKGRTYEFGTHETFIVGRSTQAHHRLPPRDKAFSRFHFMIEINPPFCRIMDMASTNGTLVNGRRVTTADLKSGDRIEAGLTVFSVTVEGGTQPPGITHELPTRAAGPIAPGPESGPEAPASPQADERSTLTWRQEPSFPPDDPTRRATWDEPIPDIPHYAIDRVIGRGGMGVVYLARDLRDGATVALKTIRPTLAGSRNAIARFLREASILRKLVHPHIIRYREMSHAGSLLYIAMEHVGGTDAFRLVRARGPLPARQAVEFALQAVEGLAYAHANGFVHRDLKPSNLLLLEDEDEEPVTVKLADFGLARIYQSSPMSGLSVMGDFAGTYGYLAPEQIVDFRATLPVADQYALGATLYYMLTRKPIYNFPKQANQRIRMILQEEPVPILTRRPDLPEALAATIHRALAREPSKRFSNVQALGRALEAIPC